MIILPKVALVVGHEATAPGAKGVSPLNCHEYEYNKGLAGLIAADLMDRCITSEIFFRDQRGILGAYEEVNRYQPICAVELHFNASSDGSAVGTETLYTEKHPKSGYLAQVVQTYMCIALERRHAQDRGWKVVKDTDRGHLNLTQAKCASVLTEPFFGDNAVDATLGYTQKNQLAYCIAQAIHLFIREFQKQN